MNWETISFDWNQVRAFLATAEEGSLSAAARALKQTQPTLSRQVGALEETLGVTLFERGRREVRLTAAGLELIDHVRAMAEAAGRISLAASGQAQDIEGRVRITATELLASYHLPAMLHELIGEAPGLVIDVVASDEIRDLMNREADIAIRHAAPTQPDLIARKVGSTRGRIYAARKLLERTGHPRTVDDLRDLDFVGVDDMAAMLDNLQQFGLPLALDQFRTNSSSGSCMLQLIREGLGFGFLPSHTAALFEDLVEILPDAFDPEIPTWLVTHRELRTSRRIRLVYDHLADRLARL